jgi:MoaA/NifB/PqqE/SkfB family radical SAM enzyme
MEDSLIDKTIGDLEVLKYRGIINWFSANEPLLDSRICDIIAKTKRQVPTCHPRLFTNGDFLTQEFLDTLFEKGLWQLKISAHDEKTYQRVSRLDFAGRNIKVGAFYRHQRSSFHNRAGLLKEFADDKRFLHYNCLRPSLNLVIRYDGQVKLCAEDLTGRTFDEHLNVRDHTLKEVWFSPEMEHYRELLAQGRRSDLRTCCDCNFHFSASEGWCQEIKQG